MRAAENLHVEWVDEEAVVLDPRTGEMHHLNTPAALVFALIQEHGYDDAVETLKNRQADPIPEQDLAHVLNELKERGMIVDD